MKLVIGGYAQGKLAYVLEQEKVTSIPIYDGSLPVEEKETPLILNHLHQWVRKRLQEGGSPEREILEFVEQYPDCIILCDEIGNGIVPMDPFEREWRERTGRILIELAKRAEEVERVICGMGQKLKSSTF